METSIIVSPADTTYYFSDPPNDISLPNLFEDILHNRLQDHRNSSEPPITADQHRQPLANSNYYPEEPAQPPSSNQSPSITTAETPQHHSTAVSDDSVDGLEGQQSSKVPTDSLSEDSEEHLATPTEQHPTSATAKSKPNPKPNQSEEHAVPKQSTRSASAVAELALTAEDGSPQRATTRLPLLPERHQSSTGASAEKKSSISFSDSTPKVTVVVRDGATLHSSSTAGEEGDQLTGRDPAPRSHYSVRTSQRIGNLTQERQHLGSLLQSRESANGDTTTPTNSLSSSNEAGESHRAVPLQVITRYPLTENATPTASAHLTSNTPVDDLQQEFQHFFRTATNDHIVRHARFVIRSNQEGEIHLLLKPEELGTMRINLHLQNNLLNGRILVEHPTARTLVEQNISELLRAFREQGIDVGTLDVALNHHSTPSFLTSSSDNQSLAEYDLALQPAEPESEPQFIADEIGQSMLINLYA